jgi:hypothetical protein
MNKTIGRFLLESWQLFYWSLFCPSKLQQRMNEWSPKKRKDGSQRYTSGSDIFLVKNDSPFIFQYIFISMILSLPLVVLVILSGQREIFFIVLIAPLFSFILGLWTLPSGMGFCSPLLLAFTYQQQASLFLNALNSLPHILPSLSQLFSGTCLGIIVLVLARLVVKTSIKKKSFSFTRYIYSVGCVLSIFFGSWIISQNWLITLLASISTGLVAFMIDDKYTEEDSVWLNLMFNVWIGVMVGIASGVSFYVSSSVVATIVATVITSLMILETTYHPVNGGVWIIVLVCVPGIVAGMVAGIATVSLPWFLLASALQAFGCAPGGEKWLGLLISAIFVVLGWENLSFNSFWALPVTMICYYRVFPDYLAVYLNSLIFSNPLLNRISLDPTSLLAKLPPHTTELVWLPLPNHPEVLAATFRQNTPFGLATFKKMQAISLPGIKLTLEKALPIIVADRFASIQNTSELINSVTHTPSLLSQLIPIFYQSDKSDVSLAPRKSGSVEIDIIFPILRKTAEDTYAALIGGSAALRERGLERLVDKLKMLPVQLPGLGLNNKAIQHWQPVIERWQHVLEQEIAEQRKISQGELLNPFQFGNPLRQDSASIFKGRQAFADQLVRLILDRNRPTLVLHGPRRAGKTSFLLNLPRLLPSDLIPIYLDMQQASMTNSEGDFCYGLVRAIQRDTRSQGLQIPSLPSRQDFITQPYTTPRRLAR